jgi:hypothetical protein
MKYSYLVKEIKFNLKLNFQLGIEIFEKFRFLMRLNIHGLEISKDLILYILVYLRLLEDFILYNVAIK